MPTLEAQVAKLLPHDPTACDNTVGQCDGCHYAPRILAFAKRVRREAIEEAVRAVDAWALSPTNMATAARYAKHGWANAVSGVLGAQVSPAIRALLNEKPSHDK